MKKHTNLWLVMVLAVSLVLPIYSMAQTSLTLEDSTGNRISTPGIKSFAMGTDNNLVVLLDQAFNFTDLIPDILLVSCTNCSITGSAGVTATTGAKLSFNVQSSDTKAAISLVAASWEIVLSTTMPTLPSTNGSAPFSWTTGSTPTGSYLAVFQAKNGDQKSQLPVMINVVPPGYTLTINATNGSVTKNPDQPTYTISPVQTVQLTATPASGYYFSGWSGDLSGTANAASIQMNGSKTVTATFTLTPPTQYAVTTSANPTAGGTVSGAGSYNAGASVTVTATPASSYTFNSWTEGTSAASVSASSSYTFTISNSRTLTANFASSNPNPPTSPNPNPNPSGLANHCVLNSNPNVNFPLNNQNRLNFGAGSQSGYICRLEGNTIASLFLRIFGTNNDTNLTFTWVLPDGTSFSGAAAGTDIGGQMNLRSFHAQYPNYNHDYIPSGDHTMTINSTGNSSVVLTVSYY